jgi:enoyl-CoA hydratase/carnithine racemase
VVISLLSHVLQIELMAELSALLSSLTAKRIVITGTDGYFAAGADIAELSILNGPKALEYARFGQAVLNQISAHRAVTIAAIDGYCMGGGLDMALSCDLRYATPKSILAHPGGRIGIMTGWGGTGRLPQIVGKTRALEMMAVGRRIPAPEAAEWGLINAAVEDPVSHALNLALYDER